MRRAALLLALVMLTGGCRGDEPGWTMFPAPIIMQDPRLDFTRFVAPQNRTTDVDVLYATTRAPAPAGAVTLRTASTSADADAVHPRAVRPLARARLARFNGERDEANALGRGAGSDERIRPVIGEELVERRLRDLLPGRRDAESDGDEGCDGEDPSHDSAPWCEVAADLTDRPRPSGGTCRILLQGSAALQRAARQVRA